MTTNVPFVVKLQVGASLVFCLSTMSLGVMTWQQTRSRTAYLQELRAYQTWQDATLARLTTLHAEAVALRGETQRLLQHDPTRPLTGTPTMSPLTNGQMVTTLATQGYHVVGALGSSDPSCQRERFLTTPTPWVSTDVALAHAPHTTAVTSRPLEP